MVRRCPNSGLTGCTRPDPHFEGFTFSPDGTYVLAVYSRSGSAPSFIYKIALDTGKAARFTTVTTGFETVPSFSSDGKRIAFTYSPDRGARSRIILANADGSDPQPW